MLAALLLLGGAFFAPVHHGREHAATYYCMPQDVCSFAGGTCPAPYSNVIISNMAASTYGNEELEVTVTRFALPQTPDTPVSFYIQWINPTKHPLLIKGPWLGAFSECIK